MSRKIGILTFHKSNNCGSVLQAYALQQTLNKFNFENEIINFSNENQENMYALFRKIRTYKDILANLATAVLYSKFKSHFQDYENFRNTYLTVSTQKFKQTEDLKNIEYDILISGSDQVWNINCPDADDAYYLCFDDDSKKIAYAPSFGAINPLERAKDPQKYINYLNKFDWLSIRENNGKKWIYDMTQRHAEVLLDPTMLLTADEWNTVIKIQPPTENYIFYYAFNYSKEVNKIVMDISSKYNMPVYILDIKSWVKRVWRDGIKITEHSGPDTFLSYIKNAKLVVTTSFHGTVFSILYKKKFWFVDSSMHNPNDDRTYTLLKQLDFFDRCITTDMIPKLDIMSEIDYSKHDSMLCSLRNKSIEWLKNAINE